MNRSITRFRIIPFLLLLLLFSFAGAARADRVDDYVAGQLRERHIPGAAIAVVKNGRITKASGYGLANVELKVPVTSDTVFEIGSISKQITAAAIMKKIASISTEKSGNIYPKRPKPGIR